MTDPQTPPDALSRPPASGDTLAPPPTRLAKRGALADRQKRVLSAIAEARAEGK